MTRKLACDLFKLRFRRELPLGHDTCKEPICLLHCVSSTSLSDLAVELVQEISLLCALTRLFLLNTCDYHDRCGIFIIRASKVSYASLSLTGWPFGLNFTSPAVPSNISLRPLIVISSKVLRLRYRIENLCKRVNSGSFQVHAVWVSHLLSESGSGMLLLLSAQTPKSSSMHMALARSCRRYKNYGAIYLRLYHPSASRRESIEEEESWDLTSRPRIFTRQPHVRVLDSAESWIGGHVVLAWSFPQGKSLSLLLNRLSARSWWKVPIKCFCSVPYKTFQILE